MLRELPPGWINPQTSDEINDRSRASFLINEECEGCIFRTRLQIDGKMFIGVCTIKSPREVIATYEINGECFEKDTNLLFGPYNSF